MPADESRPRLRGSRRSGGRNGFLGFPITHELGLGFKVFGFGFTDKPPTRLLKQVASVILHTEALACLPVPNPHPWCPIQLHLVLQRDPLEGSWIQG